MFYGSDTLIHVNLRKRLLAIQKYARKLQALLKGSPGLIQHLEEANDDIAKLIRDSVPGTPAALTPRIARNADYITRHEKEISELKELRCLISKRTSLEVEDFYRSLELLGALPDSLKRSKGGRPGNPLWNWYIAKLAALFERSTGKSAAVGYDEHLADVGQRYTGDFLSFVTMLEEVVAAAAGRQKRPNSALGPAVLRALNAAELHKK
jgi:hypothetical protein